ncbi:hypothetical protein M139_0214 [Bacteroides fragilis str. S23L24]|nr:hypothetical protein M139_0214 [Bacteroides fragilis str. S23L24]EYE48290.1 hypothetical protein M138_0190 [Bacteroides fragilis str. S23L17]
MFLCFYGYLSDKDMHFLFREFLFLSFLENYHSESFYHPI